MTAFFGTKPVLGRTTRSTLIWIAVDCFTAGMAEMNGTTPTRTPIRPGFKDGRSKLQPARSVKYSVHDDKGKIEKARGESVDVLEIKDLQRARDFGRYAGAIRASSTSRHHHIPAEIRAPFMNAYGEHSEVFDGH